MTASEKLVPEWMQKKQRDAELAEAREEARLQRQLAAERLIEIEGPCFWKALLGHLKIAVDALPVLKLAGSLSPVGLESVRISMNRPGIFPNMTYVDLFRDAVQIRCSVLNGGVHNLRFCAISDTAIAVLPGQDSHTPMTAEMASQYIIQSMIDVIERQDG